MRLGDVPVIVSPLLQPRPVLQIRSDFEHVSDGVRASMNQWLLDTFGTRDDVIFVAGKIVMSARNYQKLKDIAAIKNPILNKENVFGYCTA